MLDPIVGITPVTLCIEGNPCQGSRLFWLCFSYFQVANGIVLAQKAARTLPARAICIQDMHENHALAQGIVLITIESSEAYGVIRNAIFKRHSG